MEKVRWKNFLSTGNIWTEIELNRHPTTLIVGENGSGKSTVLDALCYGLFNKAFRKINKDQLSNTINQKGMLVEVEFRIGKRKYMIRRGRHPFVFEIFCDGNLFNQTGVKDYQEFLEKGILKLNFISFTQIVILGSSTFVPFMQLPAGQRRNIVEDLLGIKIFSSMNILLKEKIQQNKDALTDLNYQLELEKEKRSVHVKHLEELKTHNETRVSDIKNNIKESERELQELNHEIYLIVDRFEFTQKSINEASKTKRKLEEILDIEKKMSRKKQKLEEEIQFYKEHEKCPTCTQNISKETQEHILSERLKKIEEIKDAEKQLIDKKETYQNLLNELEENVIYHKEIGKELQEKNSHASSIERYIGKLNVDLNNLTDVSSNVIEVESRIAEIDEKLIEIEEQRSIKIHNKEVLETAAGMLKDKGIKTQIVKQYIPIMNKLINKYLASMEFFVNFELDENFNEIIKSRFRDEFSYGSFSEGEKKRLDLALLMTWRAIAKMKNSTNTNLLILDEVFDASLDNNGCEEFMKLLQDMGKEMNVFVISHSQNVNADKFYSNIRFEKHKNFSRIAA